MSDLDFCDINGNPNFIEPLAEASRYLHNEDDVIALYKHHNERVLNVH